MEAWLSKKGASQTSLTDVLTTPGSSLATTDASTGLLTQANLAAIVAQAIKLWEATGLTAEQDAYLQSVTFKISDLGGITLGSAAAGVVTLDDNAAGNGWYIDQTPGDNSEFPYALAATNLLTDPSLAPAGHVDLLTTVLHELGHELGLNDTYAYAQSDSLMYGYIVDGERRLPTTGEAAGGIPGNILGLDFALGPVSIGTLPTGQHVIIQYQASVDAQNNQLIVDPSDAGTVSGTNFTTLNTNTDVTTLDTLTLGNLIFNDAISSSTMSTRMACSMLATAASPASR